MIKIFTIAILIFSCFSTSAQGTGKIKLSNLIVSINAGNTLILRPQISVEFRLKKLNHLEVTSGYIAQNKSLQNNTVSFLNEDAFLSKGFHFGLGLKRMSALNLNRYYGIQAYFKKHSYSDEIWHNGPKIEEEWSGSMSYVLSNKKTQAGLYLIIGNYKALGKNFLINTFGGFGMLYYHYEKTYNEMIYNYSLRFKTKDPNNPANFIDIDTPFKENQNRIYPIVHFGIKVGFNGIKNAK